MSSSKWLLLGVLAIAAYFLLKGTGGVAGANSATANLGTGALPAGTPGLAASLGNSANSILQSIGIFAQNTPKTT